ncbi:hypothetical protein Zmor_007037 [Zophobas morio]|uniref:Uncharacterized protein n=2 Tax=Zophobas morio TaxID=2755281 RepID=A0AA38IT70_9CUCU|nr:hypothetical protein Zmor_007037 [Zophobas morio]
MISEKETYDWGEDFDDATFKSCFARSVAVNSQYKQFKTSDPRQLQTADNNDSSQETFKRLTTRPLIPVNEPIMEEVKLRKNSQVSNGNDIRRLSCSSIASSRRTSICSSRISEIPVENIVQQSKVNTLQWQLKEVEKSREMYKAVMKQVVTFLERAHRSLELLGNRLNAKPTVPRSKSEHQIVAGDNGVDTLSNTDDFTMFRDFTWRRPKKQELPPDEIPPEKLSQEAFRLLRTAQSLLNTQEPKLASVDDAPDDLEFLAQLAKEFPQIPEVKPQRATSFSLSPKLLTPEKETRISTAFNRKLSLQLNETRKTTYKYSHIQRASPRGSVIEAPFMSSTMNDFKDHHVGCSDKVKFKPESEKSNSPPAGSVSSVEDESGFSSMNSFQDVGLPIVGDEVNTKNALLRSMLHNNVEPLNGFARSVDNSVKNGSIEKDVKLWEKPDNVSHKRWSSTPVNCSSTKQSVNVLWV